MTDHQKQSRSDLPLMQHTMLHRRLRASLYHTTPPHAHRWRHAGVIRFAAAVLLQHRGRAAAVALHRRHERVAQAGGEVAPTAAECACMRRSCARLAQQSSGRQHGTELIGRG